MERDTTYPRALLNLGIALSKVGDAERASRVLVRAATEPASHADALHDLARLDRARGRPSPATASTAPVGEQERWEDRVWRRQARGQP